MTCQRASEEQHERRKRDRQERILEETNINGEMMRLRYEKEMERMIGRKDMRKERGMG